MRFKVKFIQRNRNKIATFGLDSRVWTAARRRNKESAGTYVPGVKERN